MGASIKPVHYDVPVLDCVCIDKDVAETSLSCKPKIFYSNTKSI